MAFGFPASYEAQIELIDLGTDKDRLIDQIATTLKSIGGFDVKVRQNSVSCKMDFSVWSWGESVTVSLDPLGQIGFKSKSRQIYDWGKNRFNLLSFSSRLAAHHRHRVIFINNRRKNQ